MVRFRPAGRPLALKVDIPFIDVFLRGIVDIRVLGVPVSSVNFFGGGPGLVSHVCLLPCLVGRGVRVVAALLLFGAERGGLVGDRLVLDS